MSISQLLIFQRLNERYYLDIFIFCYLIGCMSSSNRVIRKKKCKEKVSFLKSALHNTSCKSLSQTITDFKKNETLKLYIDEVERLRKALQEREKDNAELSKRIGLDFAPQVEKHIAELFESRKTINELYSEIFSLKLALVVSNALPNEVKSLLDGNRLFPDIVPEDEDSSGTGEENAPKNELGVFDDKSENR